MTSELETSLKEQTRREILLPAACVLADTCKHALSTFACCDSKAALCNIFYILYVIQEAQRQPG